MQGSGCNAAAATLSDQRLRAGTYALLANLLGAPPDADMLQHLGSSAIGATGERSDMVAAWSALKAAAGKASVDGVDEEYQELFIGLGRGELAPYGSWYLSGFLMEKPLGTLRQDLAALGYERPPQVHEPEDHVAALCEVMAMLITDDAVPFSVQRRFFETHLGSWMERFFRDLEEARSACFYRSVGCLGQAFIGLEKHYFAMLI